MDIRGFGIPEQVSIEFNQDMAPKDDLLENSDLDAYPSIGTVARLRLIPNALNWND